MDIKEKTRLLIEMGFEIEDAIDLAKGNYKRVPSDTPKDDPEPGKKGPEPDPEDPPADPPADPKPAGETGTELLNSLINKIESLENRIIQNNINGSQQPPPQPAEDLLALMINPPQKGE